MNPKRLLTLLPYYSPLALLLSMCACDLSQDALTGRRAAPRPSPSWGNDTTAYAPVNVTLQRNDLVFQFHVDSPPRGSDFIDQDFPEVEALVYRDALSGDRIEYSCFGTFETERGCHEGAVCAETRCTPMSLITESGDTYLVTKNLVQNFEGSGQLVAETFFFSNERHFSSYDVAMPTLDWAR